MSLDFVLYTAGPELAGDALETGPLGGSETAFIELGRQLATLGHRVTAYCRCPRPGVYSGVEFRDARELEVWRCGGRTDVFICSRWFSVLSRPVPARVTVLWNHDAFGPDSRRPLRAALANVSYSYCLSDFHRRQFAAVTGLPLEAIRKTCNGVDLDLIEPIRKAAVERHKIMFTSRPERGLLRALEVYERLGDRELEMLTASYPYAGSERDRALERACEARVAALREDGYPIKSGHFTKTDLYHHVAESKLVLYPCEFPEVFCIAAIEAQACGTAFLATSAFALRETASYPGPNGGDLDGFTREAARLLADGEHRRTAVETGLEHTRQFTWERVARQFVADACEHLAAASAQAATGAGDQMQNPGHLARSPYSRRQPPAADPDRGRRSRIAERVWAPDSDGARAPAGLPFISCLMVTLDRLRRVKEAVRCYLDQTYPNRELVIVTDGRPTFQRAVAGHLESLGRDDLRLITVEDAGRTLGSLRNLALAEARGDWFCQWDDDDLYHPQRLAVQAEHLAAEDAHACFLSDQLQFHWSGRRMRWVDWSRDDTFPFYHRIIPGTIMARCDGRFTYPEDGASARRGEDSAYQDALFTRVKVTTLSGAGHLYVYSYHGRNTFPEEHHAEHPGASAAFLGDRLERLREAVAYYRLPMPYTVTDARGAPLFVVNG